MSYTGYENRTSEELMRISDDDSPLAQELSARLMEIHEELGWPEFILDAIYTLQEKAGERSEIRDDEDRNSLIAKIESLKKEKDVLANIIDSLREEIKQQAETISELKKVDRDRPATW